MKRKERQPTVFWERPKCRNFKILRAEIIKRKSQFFGNWQHALNEEICSVEKISMSETFSSLSFYQSVISYHRVITVDAQFLFIFLRFCHLRYWCPQVIWNLPTEGFPESILISFRHHYPILYMIFVFISTHPCHQLTSFLLLRD